MMNTRGRWLDVLLLGVGALYLVAVFRTGWTGDDAFITLRAVDNFVHGYGLVSNPPERVLGFTNPLWALLLALPMAVGVGGYPSALGCGLCVSAAAAAVVLLRVTENRAAALVAGVWLTASSSYVDYSTSGLENPLAHLLLALFFAAYFAGKLSLQRAPTFLLAALIVANRQDHALLIAPALLSLLSRPVRPALRAALIGGAPLWLWLAFALVYYGFPFPNTAYAKLNVELPPHALLRQGLAYYADLIHRDPFTLAVIALALAQLAFDRSRQALAAGLGILLYLGYVLRIGGDFMAGRFFTAPFLVAVVWLAARAGQRVPTRVLLVLAPASLAVLLAYPTSFRARRESDCDFQTTGIASERHCYSSYTALVDNLGTGLYTHHPRWQRGLALRAQGPRVIASTNVGMMGYVLGPRFHVIDLMALTDPLLARIPFRAKDFRIGHFQRRMPRGYQDSVVSGENRIANPCIHAFYDQLLRVIRGPLFTLERARAVLELNLGRYDRLVHERCPKGATLATVSLR